MRKEKGCERQTFTLNVSDLNIQIKETIRVWKKREPNLYCLQEIHCE